MYVRLRALKFDLILVLRSQLFEYLRKTLYEDTLEHLEAVRSRKKNKTFFLLPTVNAWILLTSLKACDWSAHIFGASASPRLCHPFPLFMAVRMIPNMWHSRCYCIRHSWLTKFGGVTLEPALDKQGWLPTASSWKQNNKNALSKLLVCRWMVSLV